MVQWRRRPDGRGGDDPGRDRGAADGRDRALSGPARGRRAGGRVRAPGTAEEHRFAQVYAEDRVGPMPYPNQAVPDVSVARGRVRALVDELLPGGLDEGTGAALDPLIASWASGWLARIDSEHADHHAVIDRLVGGARQQLADAEAAHERDRRALEIARRDYADARERLMEPPPVHPAPGDGGYDAAVTSPVPPARRGGGRDAGLHPAPGAGTDTGPDDEVSGPRRSGFWDPETGDPVRRSASRGPRAARTAVASHTATGESADVDRRPDPGPDPDDGPVTGPLRSRPSPTRRTSSGETS